MKHSRRRFRALRDSVVATGCVVAIALSAARLVTSWGRGSQDLPDLEGIGDSFAGFTRRNSTAGEFDPVVLLPPVPPITGAPFIPASEATEEQVTPNELVLGLAVNGAWRAYPINMLTGPSREIINDTVGGRRLAATW